MQIIGFPFFESQAKWIAQLLSGKRVLPSWDDMMQSIKEFYLSRDVAGIPKQNTHDIAEFEVKKSSSVKCYSVNCYTTAIQLNDVTIMKISL
jgi:hypothetical protein